MKVKIATDGSHHNGKFGWGFVVTDSTGRVLGTCYGSDLIDDSWAHAWNVAAECSAVIHAIRAMKPEAEVEIIHDYEGLGKWARGEWKVKTPCSKGYVAELKKLGRKVTFQWVKGHAGHETNEIVDGLARRGLQEQPEKPVFVNHIRRHR